MPRKNVRQLSNVLAITIWPVVSASASYTCAMVKPVVASGEENIRNIAVRSFPLKFSATAHSIAKAGTMTSLVSVPKTTRRLFARKLEKSKLAPKVKSAKVDPVFPKTAMD